MKKQSQQRIRSWKEESNRNIEVNNTIGISMNAFNSRMERTWIESVNMKTEQYKVPNVNNKEKTK